MRRQLATVFIMAALPAAARAAPPHGLGLAVSGGTLGVGPELSYRWNGLFDVRVSATMIGASGHGTVSDYRYRGHLHLANWGGSIGVHPFRNGFRLAAGVRDTRANRIRFGGTPRDAQDYGGILYPPDRAAMLDGTIRARDVSPLVTIGYDRTFNSGLTLAVDGGVMLHGRPRVTHLSASGEIVTNPAAGNELAREEDQLRRQARDYPFYPIVQLGLGYRF